MVCPLANTKGTSNLSTQSFYCFLLRLSWAALRLLSEEMCRCSRYAQGSLVFWTLARSHTTSSRTNKWVWSRSALLPPLVRLPVLELPWIESDLLGAGHLRHGNIDRTPVKGIYVMLGGRLKTQADHLFGNSLARWFLPCRSLLASSPKLRVPLSRKRGC